MKKQCLVQVVLGGILLFGMSVGGSQAFADDAAQLKEQVKTLQDRVNQLESQLANKQQAGQPAVIAPAVVPVYDQWDDPFVQMARMREQMDRNMRQAFADTGVFNPRMDMKQTDKEYLITMDIPGMDKDKINIEIKGDMLVISGERRSETKDNGNQYYRQERSFGSFMQAIPLPEDARRDQIQAKYENGVLSVRVARQKKEDRKQGGGKIPVQ